jgi:O-antigen/teichoic acid export membrane protein
MTSVDFAIFSFEVSMENMLNVFVTPISITLYNNFAKHKDIQHIMKIKSNVLLWGFVVIGAAFPCKWILVNYLKNYSEASDIIFALFATQLFYAVVKGIYVNVYKVMGKQKKYFNQVMLMTAISIILNIILYSVFKSKLAIAFGTLIASIIWFIICEITNKEYRFKKNEILTMFLVLALYLFAGLFMKTNFGCIVYITGTISLSFYLMRDSVMDILVVLKSRGK